MKEKIREQLKDLTQLIGVSGNEQDVVAYIKKALIPIADKVTVSPIGNLIAVKEGSKPGPKLMITAHSDEVGYCVKTIFENGFMSFEKIGTAVDKVMPGRKVWIRTNKNGLIPAVIGIKAGHLQSDAEKSHIQTTRELFLDVAASSIDEVQKMGIKVGDRFTIQSDFMVMNNPDYVCTKAIDNRISCVAILQLFEALQNEDFAGTLYGVVTVQEESGFLGARVVSNIVKPDYAIVMDTIPCIDTPDCNPSLQHPVWMGKGPVCAVDFGVWVGGWFHLIHPKVREIIEENSEKTGINVQYLTGVESGYTTDAPEIAFGHEGIPTGTLAIPRRYAHSPIELVNLNDAVDLVNLLKSIVIDNGNKDLGFLSE